MALESKAVFLKEVERQLSSTLCLNDMRSTMHVLADTLAQFTMETQRPEAELPDDLLDAYISALSVEGRSPKTLERYRYIISRMRKAVNVQTRQITVYHLRKYLSDEKARGISDRTLESTREVFSSYFNWLHREGLIDTNPVSNLGVIKYLKKQKDLYSDVDIERMKFACKSLRDRAIICFLKATGCRISEMVQLNRTDVDLEQHPISSMPKLSTVLASHVQSNVQIVLSVRFRARGNSRRRSDINNDPRRTIPDRTVHHDRKPML